MLSFMILRFFHFDKIMSYAVILHLSGKNSRCFLLIVVPVTGVCLFIVLWLVFHNWVYWTRGNLLASRVMYILASVRFRCVECRAGTSIFGRFAGLGGGPVRVSCPFGFVLACVCVIEQVGGVAGQYDFSSISAFFGGPVRLKL
jgi:hypothetical protein